MIDWDEEEVTGFHAVDVQQIEEQPVSAFFIVLAGKGVGEMFRLGEARSTIGRSVKADIQLLDDAMSRIHCEVERTSSGEALLRDAGSKNGTYVNGKRVDTKVLQDGDKVQVGGTTILKFTLSDELEETFQRHLYDSAMRDGLTKAFNKKYLMERLVAEYAYSIRHGTPLSFVMMDLDHFKRINDEFGHQAGDNVLYSVAQRIEATIRTEDVFARYGGEEFAIVARGIRPREGAIMSERIRKGVEKLPFTFKDQAVKVTISLGVAGVPHAEIQSATDLVDAADKALYEAKNSGRNRVVVYSETRDHPGRTEKR